MVFIRFQKWDPLKKQMIIRNDNIVKNVASGFHKVSKTGSLKETIDD